MIDKLFIALMLMCTGASEKSLHTVLPPATDVLYIPAPPPPTVITGHEHWDVYINKYKQAACDISSLTGIPASIIIAQGILEGDAGRSVLVTVAHNHFGVKCRHDCKKPGHCINYKDDHANDRFLAFASDAASFAYQAGMLRRGRYEDMVCLYGADYKKWVIGLQERGYATTKSYAALLGSIIKNGKLYVYDNYAAWESAHRQTAYAAHIARCRYPGN